MDLHLFTSVFITLFVIMDPPGTVPIFMSLTKNNTPEERNSFALQAVLVAGGIIVAFALFGQQILDYMQISLPAMRMAGGLLLVIIALELLSGKTGSDDEPDELNTKNVAFVPLGIPLMAGPGAIVTVMLYVREATNGAQISAIALGVVLVLFIFFLFLRFSGVIQKVLGTNGVELITKISGLLLCAIAIQMMADSTHEFISLWMKH
ncbi:MAG: MarC family protein [Micrococcaceae bacterium]